jgi:hypothetical protein
MSDKDTFSLSRALNALVSVSYWPWWRVELEAFEELVKRAERVGDFLLRFGDACSDHAVDIAFEEV